jgi:hypothetical protein
MGRCERATGKSSSFGCRVTSSPASGEASDARAYSRCAPSTSRTARFCFRRLENRVWLQQPRKSKRCRDNSWDATTSRPSLAASRCPGRIMSGSWLFAIPRPGGSMGLILCTEKDHARPTKESRGAASNGTSMAKAPEPPGRRFVADLRSIFEGWTERVSVGIGFDGAIHAAARRSVAKRPSATRMVNTSGSVTGRACGRSPRGHP